MRDATIARNYAEALLELARQDNAVSKWGETIDEIGTAMQADRKLFVFLESPRVSATDKKRVLAAALEGQVPLTFLRFLQTLVRNRRQMLIPEIAVQYHGLLDEIENRVHAAVTVAKEGDAAQKKAIAARLSKVVGKEVVPHFFVNPAIIGGVIVRVGDTVMDGSVRRRLAKLKTQMLGR